MFRLNEKCHLTEPCCQCIVVHHFHLEVVFVLEQIPANDATAAPL